MENHDKPHGIGCETNPNGLKLNGLKWPEMALNGGFQPGNHCSNC
jgi:hypothetical protein